jgi:tetratricopeptide (TPR) repeat protein
MPIWRGKRHEIPDPVFFDPIMADQKKAARDNPSCAEALLELGRLYEAKITWTNQVAKHDLLVRHAFSLVLLTVGLPIVVLMPRMLNYPFPSWLPCVLAGTMTFMMTALCEWIWSLRYPPSGTKYFKKAIELHPDCAEAYMYLGLIAFRRFQGRKAYRFLQKALHLGLTDSQLAKGNCRGLVYYLFNKKPR